MAKYLVLGSSGFVGAPLCEYLEMFGHKVIRFDLKEQHDARHRRLPLQGVDRVFFLAWDVGGAKYLYSPDTQVSQLRWNGELMNAVFPQLVAHDFTFVSSAQAATPTTAYAAQKRVGEIWATQLRGTVVRLWNVYGAYEDSTQRSHVVGDMIHSALTRGKIDLMSQGREYRRFCYIDDVVHAIAMASNSEGPHDVVRPMDSVYDVANMIATMLNVLVLRGDSVGTSPDMTIHGNQIHCPTPLWDGLRKTVNLYMGKRRG